MSSDPNATPAIIAQRAQRAQRAAAIAAAGGVENAMRSGALGPHIDTTVSEAVVLGLLRQDVRTFFCVLGHGSTELGEVLRAYHEAGLLRACAVRHETEAAHAATALRWVKGQKAAVITSIGPGAMHAFAGSLASASDGVGVWHIYGDETTEDEGPNMQQIPKHEQGLFLKLCSVMGNAYALHTPGALSTALRRGLNTVDDPHRAGPFFLLLPMNVQPQRISNFHVEELPVGAPPRLGPAADGGTYEEAAALIQAAARVVVKVGGGAHGAGAELIEFLELAGAVAVTSPLVSGVIRHQHDRNMLVGGSKGTLCGNFAMDEADLLVAVGTRFVCQSDCSRTGYPKAKHVVNINTDAQAATHYGRTIAMVGDAASTLRGLNEALRKRGTPQSKNKSDWLTQCADRRRAWESFKAERYAAPTIRDPLWGRPVLTQPAAIKIACDWAASHQDVVKFFDAGDPQANGFQIVEDDRLGRTCTETGASYMGFAVSALLATAVSHDPFYGLAISGEGSFTMNPQVLIDGTEHGAHGCILLLDNRRMGAISGLQWAQYKKDFATSDAVEVDYLAWARAISGVGAFDGGASAQTLTDALERAYGHKGLSMVHVPVYCGHDDLGAMGAFGRWNVGPWCQATQALRHEIGL